jgi:indolepyruvate ferredoxin oxidoreductase
VHFLDASEFARVALGDSIFSNMVLLGMAWQAGLVPLSEAAIREAVRLNGAGVEANLRAFDLGRWAQHDPAAARALMVPKVAAPVDPIAFRVDHLRTWQDDALAERYVQRVKSVPEALRLPVAKGYHKLLAYKDEYEVARLHLQTIEKAQEQLSGDFRPVFHLAPPILGGTGPDGRPKKREFGPWILPLFRLLARMKWLRGTKFDPFARHPERQMERALIAQYEADLEALLPLLSSATESALKELAELPLTIRGYGPVKEANAAKAAKRRDELIAIIRAGGAAPRLAA